MKVTIPRKPDLDDVERRLTLLCMGLGHLLERGDGQPEPEELGALMLVAFEAREEVRALLAPGEEIKGRNGEEG